MNRIKTAVVGVGALGKHHLKWLNEIPESDLVGLYDTDSERAAQYADQYGITAFESLASVAEAADAVSIVAPTTHHFEIAAILMKAGVHCLIEKPVTATTDEAEKLLALAGQHDVKVSVGHIERFNPAVRALSKYNIRPAFIEAHRLAAFDPRGTDVAVVLDLMIHDIDLALFLTQSSVIDIQASAVAVVSEQADIANARLTFANGSVANLTASRISLHAMRKLRIFQKDGYYSLDLGARQADVYRLDSSGDSSGGMRLPLGKSGRELVYEKKTDDGADQLGEELRSFLKAVIESGPVAVTLREAAEAVKIALEVQQKGLDSLERMLKAESS